MTEQAWIIRLEALRLARNQVKQDIRDRGERLKDYALKDINRLGELWFARHPELIEEATIGLLFRRSKLASDAQKKQDEKSMASPVQKSRSKVEASS